MSQGHFLSDMQIGWLAPSKKYDNRIKTGDFGNILFHDLYTLDHTLDTNMYANRVKIPFQGPFRINKRAIAGK